MQLITDVQVAPNTTDDQTLLKRSLEEQSERDLAIGQVTSDGGYTGPEAEQACSNHGGSCAPRASEAGKAPPIGSGGRTTSGSVARRADQRRADRSGLSGGKGRDRRGRGSGRAPDCAVRAGSVRGVSLAGRAVSRPKAAGGTDDVRVGTCGGGGPDASGSKGGSPDGRRERAPVEATMWCHTPSRTPSGRSVKRGLRGGPQGDKLPTCGLERARMVMSGAALMVNMRRLHRRREQKQEEGSPKDRSGAEKLLFFAFLWALRALRRKVRGKQGERPPRRTKLG